MEYIVLPVFEKYIFRIELFGTTIGATWYGTMYALGFLIGYLFLVYWAKKGKIRLSNENILDIVFVVFLGVIIGGRLGYVIFYNLPYYLENPHKIIAVWEGGMSFHGGLIGVVVAVSIYAGIKKFNAFDILDLLSIPVPIGIGLGRIGNFINQELYGRVAEGIPWAMVFPTDPEGLPRHPSQLYEAFLEGLVLFLIMFFTRNVKMPVGIRSSLFAIFYSLFRIISEFFREPDPQIGYILGFITMGQILSFVLLLVGIVLLVYFRNQNIPSKIMVYGNVSKR